MAGQSDQYDPRDQWVRDLPPGTMLRDPFTGERAALSHHTDMDDGWWLNDGSWIRWHHVPLWLDDANAPPPAAKGS
jgi:hypothetical protein